MTGGSASITCPADTSLQTVADSNTCVSNTCVPGLLSRLRCSRSASNSEEAVQTQHNALNNGPCRGTGAHHILVGVARCVRGGAVVVRQLCSVSAKGGGKRQREEKQKLKLN